MELDIHSTKFIAVSAEELLSTGSRPLPMRLREALYSWRWDTHNTFRSTGRLIGVSYTCVINAEIGGILQPASLIKFRDFFKKYQRHILKIELRELPVAVKGEGL